MIEVGLWAQIDSVTLENKKVHTTLYTLPELMSCDT